MTAINFPDSPSDGDTHVVGGVTYTYNNAETKWKTTINSNAFLPLTGGTVTGTLTVNDDLAVDTDTLFVDASTNQVGIGTTTVNDKVVIAHADDEGLTFKATGTDGTTATQITYEDTNGGTGGILQFDHGNNSFSFETAGSERARIDSSGNFQFNSGYGSVATAYGVRAWINFDGTSGSIGTGDANGNISGVTDLGTGDYTIAIDNDMPDANYVIAGHVNYHQAWGGMVLNARADGTTGTKTAGSFSLATIDGDSPRDFTDVGVLVLR